MKTLLLQNQQIIIQQQNMMFLVMKQFHPQALEQQGPSTSSTSSTNPAHSTNNVSTSHITQDIIQLDHHQHHEQQQFHHPHTPVTNATIQLSSQQQHSLQTPHHHHSQQQSHDHQSQISMFNHHQMNETQEAQSGQPNSANLGSNDQHHQHMQQVPTPAHMQADNINSAFLTPVASEQDPSSDTKPDQDDISVLLENDSLLTGNLLYNPQTDIGQITPYKNHHSHHSQHLQQSQQQNDQTPSYYSSGCESLTTPRVEQQGRQLATANISQNVVKNLADSFKSPSKPKINVSILSGSATRNMKNSKAKIIQRMNISEFLRHVHQDDQATSQQHPIKSSATQ